MPDREPSATVPAWGSQEHEALVAEEEKLIGPLLNGAATAEQRARMKALRATLDEVKRRRRP